MAGGPYNRLNAWGGGVFQDGTTGTLDALKSLFNRTINSVPFGIAVMLAIGGYIAIGSGLPSVRAAFEMTDMQFFNTWVLKGLMALLVVSLVTVTWRRIPFTPPRYGVWMVHSGIIVLIFGMAAYYATKREGMVMVPLGGTVGHFYDGEERALFLRPSMAGRGGMPAAMVPLGELPRFGTYEPDDAASAKALGRAGLMGIEPKLWMKGPADAAATERKLGEAMGLKGPLTVDIVGYWPYATIQTKWVEDVAGGAVGIVLSLDAPHLQSTATLSLVASDPQSAGTTVGDAELEHRQMSDPSSLKLMELAAKQIHRLAIQVGEYDQTMYVSPGREVALGTSGYSFTVEDFNPAFPAMNGQVVPLLTLMVKTPTQTFRRQVIPDRAAPTDWKLGVEGAGPLGKRQTAPLDANLKIAYTFSDPMRLSPRESAVKHTFVTAGERTVDLVTGLAAPTREVEMEGGKGAFDVMLDGGPVHIAVSRSDHLRRDDQVRPVSAAQRNRDDATAGTYQIVLVKLTAGDFSRVVAAPYLPYLMEHPEEWNGPIVEIPGTGAAVQLQLGRTMWRLPVAVTLERFDLEHYPGGAVMGGMPRDFISTLRLEDRETGRVVVDQARMNHPVYYPPGLTGKTWTFFQAQWDPQGQRWTVLGVGTRHGTWVMVLGCILIAAGLMWAFYLKPIIIRRMKAKALAAAGRRKAEAA